jgi:energy-converting hydrogenase Eha subunit E
MRGLWVAPGKTRDDRSRRPVVLSWIALPVWLRGQALYYVAMGVWPLVHLGSFEAVTGPNLDDGLVRTVGLLTAAIGLALWAGARIRPPSAIVQLSAMTAASFLAIAAVHVFSGRSSQIDLLDAALELVFLVAIVTGWRGSRFSPWPS